MSNVAAGFSGSVPENYDRYRGPGCSSRTRRISLRGFLRAMVLRVLELACGTGIVTRRLRVALPESATLVVTDLNQPMIDYARETVGAPGID